MQIDSDEGKATAVLPIEQVHRNPYGIVHGGVYASLADNVMGAAVASSMPDDRHFHTVDLHVRYARSISEGTLHAFGKVVKPGRRLVMADCEITDESGRLLATATASFFVVEQ